jgi:hypothetical protein
MFKRIIPLVAVVSTLALPFSSTLAQELDASVIVNYEAVASTNKDLLRDFESDIRNYLNNFKWGSDNLDEKVKCTFNIFIKSAISEERYSAQIFVGSQRKLYGSEKSATVLRILDETWDFTYVKNRPINRNVYTFNDLASVLDFYAYVIIGFDYDTYERLSGKPFLQRAADVASLGRSSGQKGWLPSKSGYSRVQFIDELNDSKFAPVRTASYIYYFTGMDSLAVNRPRAWKNILGALDMIAKTKAVVDPRNVVIKSFFDSNYMELAGTFLTYPDPAVYIKLSSIDPSHQKTYEEYRAKRQSN